MFNITCFFHCPVFYNGYIAKRGLQNDTEFLRDDILRVAAEAFGNAEALTFVMIIFKSFYQII